MLAFRFVTHAKVDKRVASDKCMVRADGGLKLCRGIRREDTKAFDT